MHAQKRYKLYINHINKMKKRLINIRCDDSDSFKYSMLLYLYYYNIKTNYNKPNERDKHRKPSIEIIFNKSNDVCESERDNHLIDLLIIDTNDNSIFLTCNNASIKVIIVKLNDYRCSLYKLTLEFFNDNINEKNKINNNKRKYALTDEIRKELALDPNIYQKM